MSARQRNALDSVTRTSEAFGLLDHNGAGKTTDVRLLNGLLHTRMGEIIFPTGMWILLALWVTPAIAAMAQGVMVLISSRVSTFQEAYQLGGMIVLPVVLLIVGQAAGVVFFSLWLVVLLGAVIWIVNAFLFKLAADRFQRERLLLSGI